MYPIIKWSGSKRSVGSCLSDRFPTSYGDFIVPFVGGGSILEYVKRDSNIVAGDVIPQLVDVLNIASVESECLVREYSDRQLFFLNAANKTQAYNQIRDRFNSDLTDGVTKVFDFHWLMFHCYNGLVRFNQSGKFNVAFHFGRDGVKTDRLRKALFLWESLLKNRFICRAEDYKETLSYAKPGDFVFLDPPYVSTRGMYSSAKVFDYKELYAQLKVLNSKGVSWMLTLDKNIAATNHMPESSLYITSFQSKSGVSHFRNLKVKQQELHSSDTVFINY